MKKVFQILPVLSGICFGSAGIFVRELSLTMDSMTIVASRMMMAVLILAVGMAIFHRDYFKIRLKDIWIFPCSGILGTLGLNICYNFALKELTLSLSAVLLSLAPVFVILMAFIIFHEPVGVKKVVCVLMAIVGCVLSSGGLEGSSAMKWSWIGIFVGGCGAFFYALYSIFSKTAMERGYAAFTITFYSMLSICIVLLPFTRWDSIGATLAQAPLKMGGFMILHSLCTAVFPYVFYTLGLNYMEAGKASILSSCEPVAAMVFGAIFFDEIPTPLSILGLVIVLVALAMLVLSPKTQEMAENGSLANTKHQ